MDGRFFKGKVSVKRKHEVSPSLLTGSINGVFSLYKKNKTSSYKYHQRNANAM